MPSPQSTQVGHQKSLHIPTYLPLPDAAKRYGLSEKALTQQIQAGKIEAVQLPTGELLVSAENNGHNKPKTKEEIITEKFTHLRKKPITIAEATKAYHVQRITLLGWIKLGYVGVLNRKERPMMIDEAEIAYCAKIYHERKGKRGTRLFDESGNPYQLKRPDVAEYRRRRQEAVKI